MSFELDVGGFEQALDEVDDTLDDLKTAQRYLVGTNVEYAIYLEAGTSKMDAKPFFAPAINEVRLQGVDGFIRHNTKTSVEQLDTVNRVLQVLALALERRIKEIITQKGLIDTGTLRASIVAVPGTDPSVLPDASEFSGFDSDNPAPPTAGRSLASESIDINI
jgi:hypothetical protein